MAQHFPVMSLIHMSTGKKLSMPYLEQSQRKMTRNCESSNRTIFPVWYTLIVPDETGHVLVLTAPRNVIEDFSERRRINHSTCKQVMPRKKRGLSGGELVPKIDAQTQEGTKPFNDCLIRTVVLSTRSFLRTTSHLARLHKWVNDRRIYAY